METTLARIRRAPSILEVMLLVDELVERAWRTFAGGSAAEAAWRSLREAALDSSDAPTAIAAAHALAILSPTAHLDDLVELLDAHDVLAPHVAWALGNRRATPRLIPGLADLLEAGRLGGMLAQRTLLRWSDDDPRPIALALEGRLRAAVAAPARARLVETLGLAGAADDLLASTAADPAERFEARIAAIAALGDRPGSGERVLARISASDDPAADAARLALLDHRTAGLPVSVAATDGLRIAQVHLGGHLDQGMAHAGEGDTGGIATLLVQLGDALAEHDAVVAVTTVGRGTAAEALVSLAAATGDHSVVAAPLAGFEETSFAGGWPAVIAAERGLRRIFRLRRPSLLHLRMADVGTLAAARIARREGIRTVFTLAPDPQALIAEMERSGELDRANFGPADARGGLWYRARLVRHLADSAHQVALFPRPEVAARLRTLVGIDIAAVPGRYHLIPEGIDLRPVEAARVSVADPGRQPAPVIRDLSAGIDALGAHRRGLPLVTSVGRLADVKGMARIVEAFAADAGLRARANLVIVGGNFADPTPEERAEIDRMEAALAMCPELAEGLVLLGHRPHHDVLRVLAVAEYGCAPWISPGGAYVCGSRKEEFGLAIVEALATGLPVVAPHVGGPSSYVEHGVTGLLVDTLDRPAVAAAIHGALDLAPMAGRAARARRLVEERFTIRRMADTLVPVYAAAVPERPSARRVGRAPGRDVPVAVPVTGHARGHAAA